MPYIEEYDCADCLAVVPHPTAEEKRRGVCPDCRRRARRRAYQELCALDEQHADVLDDI